MEGGADYVDKMNLETLMVRSHCTGPGLGMIVLYIMPLTVHTTRGQGQRMGPGTSELHTHIPIPGSVQCERAISFRQNTIISYEVKG